MNVADFSIFNGRRILVTGSTGFKGSWLCAWLDELGAKVSGFALPPWDDAPLFDQLSLRDRIDQHDGDIRENGLLTDVVQETAPEVIIHLAAQALVRRSYDEPKTTFDTNVGGAVNLMEAVCAASDLKALVFITSDKAYRNKEWVWGYRENDELGGKDPYSASKAAAEHVFEAYFESFLRARSRFGAVTARAGNVIGGGDMSADRIVPDCIRSLRKGEPISVRNPVATRPWQHVMEPLSGYLALAAGLLESPKGLEGGWNFGPDTENVRTVKELAETAVEIWENGSVEVAPQADAPYESRLLVLSSDKAKTDLGWRPRWDFDTATRRTIEWYRDVDSGADAVERTRADIANYMEAE